MPSFAEIKDKAVKAKVVSINKIRNMKDRHIYTSVLMKKTNWDPYSETVDWTATRSLFGLCNLPKERVEVSTAYKQNIAGSRITHHMK
ncbi:hypothetical protein C8J56DRAFT_193001 [Mycena floridula]|nr:hypothetical protein C8J56DRAFT_193001 [Mycena floridula]